MAQMVGLWLAEGGTKLLGEVTITNNNLSLISGFHYGLWANFRPKYLPRVYVYLPSPAIPFARPVPNASYRTYTDPRATKPYYIYRVSGVELVREWREKVAEACRSRLNYKGILQGFFAGEGNVKEDLKRRTRVLRIAQAKRVELIENILSHFGVSFSYTVSESGYVISGRGNLEKLWALDISRLHAVKHAKFSAMLATYKEYHYAAGSLGPAVFHLLSSPLTTLDVATKVGRSRSRALQVLLQLRHGNQIEMFKVRSTYYWIRKDQKSIVISVEKSRILNTLARPRRLFEISRIVKRTEKAVKKRLVELVNLNLVVKVNSYWQRLETTKRVIAK